MADIDIQGEVAAGFEAVQEAFAGNFDDIEVGASVTIYAGDEKVVDLWGGFLDREMAQPWQRDTLVNMYSTTKGLGAAAIAVLADRGLVDYNALVTAYWPEFAQQGKGGVTVAQLLSHQGAVPGLRSKVTVEDLYDLDGVADRLAAEEPFWEPGTAAGYHAMNWGHLANAVVRRACGRTLGQVFAEEVAGPLGADVHIGVPESALSRCAPMIGPNHARRQPDPDAPLPRMPRLYPVALMNPSPRAYADVSSTPWRQAEIAAANGHGNAAGVARIYAALANGGTLQGQRLMTSEGVAMANVEEVGEQEDLVLGRPMRRSRGFILNTENQYGPEQSSFGHAGAGGSVGFADPVRQVGFGYVMNQMQPALDGDTRAQRLIDCFYTCLARRDG